MQKIFIFILSVCLVLPLISCGGVPPADAAVSEGISAEPELPSGKIYKRSASEDQSGYISDALLVSMYGDGQPPAAIAEAYDYSFFLSDGNHPCEVAVFYCSADHDAVDIAMLCFRRAEIIKAAWADTPYAAISENAEVTILSLHGVHCVVMTVCSDNRSVISAIKNNL